MKISKAVFSKTCLIHNKLEFNSDHATKKLKSVY